MVPGEPQSVFDYTVWMTLTGCCEGTPQGDFRNDRGGFKLAIQQEVLDFICTWSPPERNFATYALYKLAAARRDDPAWEEGVERATGAKALWNGLILPDEAPSLLSPANEARTGSAA